MFISKSLAKKLRHPASVLLRDGVDKDGIPKIVVRQVKSAWGKFEPTGRQGGVCFSALSDGTTQTIYAGLLGYHTGTEASIQPLILNDYFWRSKMPLAGLPSAGGGKIACFPSRHRSSYHSLKAHNHELLVL